MSYTKREKREGNEDEYWDWFPSVDSDSGCIRNSDFWKENSKMRDRLDLAAEAAEAKINGEPQSLITNPKSK